MRARWIWIIPALTVGLGCNRQAGTPQENTTGPTAKAETPVSKAPEIRGRITKHKVMGKEMELKFSSVNISGNYNLDDGNHGTTLDLSGLLTMPLDTSVLGISQLEPSEATSEKGNDLLAATRPNQPATPGKPGTTPQAPPRYYSPVDRPRPNEKNVQRGVSMRLSQVPELPRTLNRVKGALYLLMKVKSITKDLPLKEDTKFIDLGSGYAIQLAMVQMRANTVTIQAKLRRPADDPANYQGHRFKLTAVDDKGDVVLGGGSEAGVTKESPGSWFFGLMPGRTLKKLQVTVNTEMKEESIPFDLDRVPIL